MSDSTNELALVARIRELIGEGPPDLLLGVGDDTAIVRPSAANQLVTMDTMVEGVHFRFDWSSAREVGRKAASTNLSDIAAMGGRPRWATLSLSLPAHADGEAVEEVFRGVVERLEEFGATLIGGDLTGSPGPWAISLTLIGEVGPAGALLRSGARVGDVVWVAGALGDAALALRCLERGEARTPGAARRALVDPVPRCRFGEALGRSGLAHAAIDVSDGLLRDLGHVCRASGVAAEVALERLPCSEELRAWRAEQEDEAEAWRLLAAGGEDYALVVTAPADAESALRALHAASGESGPLAAVGHVVAGAPQVRLSLRGAPIHLASDGWDHFARDREDRG